MSRVRLRKRGQKFCEAVVPQVEKSCFCVAYTWFLKLRVAAPLGATTYSNGGRRTLKNYLVYSCTHAEYWQVSKPAHFNSDVFRERSCSLLTPIKVNVLNFSLIKPKDINSCTHGGRGCRIKFIIILGTGFGY